MQRLHFRDADPSRNEPGTVRPIAAGDRELIANFPADSRRYEIEQDESGVRLYRTPATMKPTAAPEPKPDDEPELKAAAGASNDAVADWFKRSNRAACDTVAEINARNAAFWARK